MKAEREAALLEQGKAHMDKNKHLAGGTGYVGRTGGTFADVILQKSRLLDGPHVPNIKPTPAAPLTPPQDGQATAAPVTPTTPHVSPTSPVAEATREEKMQEERKRHEQIVKQATENKEWYELARLDDGNKQPWFFYTKQKEQYSEWVLLSPEWAQQCLDHLWDEEEGNRSLDMQTVDKYTRDMTNGSWYPTEEAISIDYRNVVSNGRHRLTALIKAKVTLPFYFTFNTLTLNKFFIDSGKPRTDYDRMRQICDTTLGNRTPGFCKAIMRGLGGRVKYTASELSAFAIKWENLLHWIAKHLPSARAEVQAAVSKAYLFHGPELVEPFCDRLRNIRFTEDGDPAKALFVALSRQKGMGQLVAYKKTLQALDALLNKRPLNKVYEKEEDIFNWLPGWELPPKS